jgi:hypothetical protein
LEKAFKLNQDAALKSASWGRFQIMGEAFDAAGFSSVRGFVLALSRAEAEHIKAFVSFIGRKSAALRALRSKDWARFAAAYNGPGYKNFNYDEKIENAYKKFAKIQMKRFGM